MTTVFPHNHRLRYRVIKRLIDFWGSVIGLILVSIVFIPIAFAIKINSAGPIFFTQTRLTQAGRKFKMYKFRTMHLDKHLSKQEFNKINEATGPLFKSKRDPRLTSVGRFLRQYSLDELPQFWNVFKGEMSLVGPRPPIQGEVERYEDWQKRRLSVKTGMTGLWQVSGRSNIDFYNMVLLDLWYIDHPSVWIDLKIILRTIPEMLFHIGAY